MADDMYGANQQESNETANNGYYEQQEQPTQQTKPMTAPQQPQAMSQMTDDEAWEIYKQTRPVSSLLFQGSSPGMRIAEHIAKQSYLMEMNRQRAKPPKPAEGPGAHPATRQRPPLAMPGATSKYM